MVELKTKNFAESDTSCDLRIMFDNDSGVLHVKWSGSTSLHKFRKGFAMALAYSRTYRANKWLMDLSEWTVLPENIHTCITANVFPKILKSSKKNCFVAGVLPVNYYNSVQDWYDSSELVAEDHLLLFNHFLLPEVGLRWLESLS